MCADAARKGSSATSSNPPSSIFQYGDWFSRYPYGVSQSDFEDPAVGMKQERGDDAVLEEKSDYQTVERFFHTLEHIQPQERLSSKLPKRKTKKSMPAPQGQLDPGTTNVTAMAHGQSMQMQSNSHQIPQAFSQMSPTTPVNMYNQQQPYYGQDVMIPPHPQGALPQLDRQLVLGAYAGMDPSSLSTHAMLDNATAWDMPMGGVTGFVAEPSSAWFMPFNMEPPDLGREQDIFNTMAGASGYATGGMQVNNNGNTGHSGG